MLIKGQYRVVERIQNQGPQIPVLVLPLIWGHLSQFLWTSATIQKEYIKTTRATGMIVAI